MEPKSGKQERLESPYSIPDLDIEVLKADTVLRRALPVEQFQYVDVTFNSNANADTDIAHDLMPPTPDDVDFIPVRWSFASAPAAAPVVYIDTAATRKAWGEGYIVLRCNVASAVATLLLVVRKS